MAQKKKGLGDGMKMKPENKGILVLAAFLVFFAGIYLILKNRNEDIEERRLRDEEASRTPLTSGMDLSGISYTDGTDTMSYVKEDGKWLYEPDREIALDQEVLGSMERVFSNLTADRELKEGDGLEDYGLEEALYTVKLTGKEDGETVIYVGNSVDGGRYVTVDDKARIYTVDDQLTEQLYFSLDQVALQETFSIQAGSGNLRQVAVSGPDGEKVYVNDEKDGDESGLIDTVIGGLGAISFHSCADYHAAEEELAAYGLDEASRITVTVVYTEEDETKTEVFYVGGESQGERYVQLEGSAMVHLVSAEAVENVIVPEE